MNIKSVTSEQIAACPLHIMSPRHYNDDGRCDCLAKKNLAAAPAVVSDPTLPTLPRKKKKPKHAMQPVVVDEEGVARFQVNPIVRHLLDAGIFDLKALRLASADMGWTDADWAHFTQLIGYSVSGWGDLSYVSSAQYQKAHDRANAAHAARTPPEADGDVAAPPSDEG